MTHHRHCPGCGRWTAPYDDEPWPEGDEWTAAYECPDCLTLWTVDLKEKTP